MGVPGPGLQVPWPDAQARRTHRLEPTEQPCYIRWHLCLREVRGEACGVLSGNREETVIPTQAAALHRETWLWACVA